MTNHSTTIENYRTNDLREVAFIKWSGTGGETDEMDKLKNYMPPYYLSYVELKKIKICIKPAAFNKIGQYIKPGLPFCFCYFLYCVMMYGMHVVIFDLCNVDCTPGCKSHCRVVPHYCCRGLPVCNPCCYLYNNKNNTILVHVLYLFLLLKF